jgi:chromosome segregation ATPase
VVRGLRETKEAEGRIVELTDQVEQARRQIADLHSRNRDLDSQLKETAERFRVLDQSSSPSTSEGLTEVLQAAERALGRLTETARRNAEQELGQTERARDDLREEIDRLAAWRARMAPLSESVPESIQDVRREASGMAGRLREAMGPFTDAINVLSARLSELAETPAAPPEIPAEGDVIRLDDAGSEANAEIPPTPRTDSAAWAPPHGASSNTG